MRARVAHWWFVRRLRRRCAVSSQFFGCGKYDGRGTAGAAPRIKHEAVCLVLGASTPIEAYTVVAWLACALTIDASWLLFAAIYNVSGLAYCVYSMSQSGALTTSPCALYMAYDTRSQHSTLYSLIRAQQTYQHPVRLLRFGSGAPSFFGRGMADLADSTKKI